MKKMRVLCLVFSVSAIWAGVSPAVDSTGFTELRLTNRVLLLEHGPWSETMTVIDAGSELVVVDTWASPRAAAKAKIRMEAVFRKPVRHVIDTHHHWDHTFGNQAFAGATIVGHQFCAGDMKTAYENPAARRKALDTTGRSISYESIRNYIGDIQKEVEQDFRLTLPTHLVGDREVLKIGDLTFRLFHAPGLHTRSNLTIYVPELGILFTRREFDGKSAPVLEKGVDVQLLTKILEEILSIKKPIRYLIPGHGNAIENPDIKAAMDQLKKLGR